MRCERASLQRNDIALTFLDYEPYWGGVEITLTWSQLYRRMINVAAQISQHGTTGDRALILAPQSLDYVVAFLATLHAGFVAVPLSVPQGGAHDGRTTSVMADTRPAVVLTASSVMGSVSAYVAPRPGRSDTAVIEVDRLDLDARPGSATRSSYGMPAPLYLQYTSGSTRAPAGVMLSASISAASMPSSGVPSGFSQPR